MQRLEKALLFANVSSFRRFPETSVLSSFCGFSQLHCIHSYIILILKTINVTIMWKMQTFKQKSGADPSLKGTKA